MNRQFAINLRDGRVVLCTRETLANIDYYAISERVAIAIESGVVDRRDVISKIKGKLLTNQEEWDALLSKKTTQNVRHSEINAESSEKSETRIEKEDVKEEFDMSIPIGSEDMPQKPCGKGHGKKTIVRGFAEQRVPEVAPSDDAEKLVDGM